MGLRQALGSLAAALLPKRRFARYSVYAFTLTLALGIGAEVTLRIMGFGDPPLYELDPAIEYYVRAGSYRRYGNLVRVNRFGMRSDEVRPRGDQLRVLLVGDSIVFGTYRVSQHELISTFLEPELRRLSGRDVEVLNAAASSWGPENQEAYLKRFGTFDADLAVWVLSSHDASDVPTPGFAKMLPQRSRWLALGEIYDLLQQKRFQGPPAPGDPLLRSLEAVENTVALFRKAGVPLMVAQHWSTEELERGLDKTGLRLEELLSSLHVPVFSLKPALVESRQHSENPFQDSLHVSPAGARAVGVAIARELHRTHQDVAKRVSAPE